MTNTGNLQGVPAKNGADDATWSLSIAGTSKPTRTFRKDDLKVEIDKSLCIGSGNCSVWAENVFGLKEGKAYIKEDSNLTKNNLDKILKAAKSCPVSAIRVMDSKGIDLLEN